MVIMENAALVTQLQKWMDTHYPGAPFDWDRWAGVFVAKVPYRELELQTALRDWHLDRPPYPSEVSFRLRRAREGVAVKSTIEALRDQLAEKRERRLDTAEAEAQRRSMNPGLQHRLPLPHETPVAVVAG